MPTPCARNAFRISGLSSSCDSIRTSASRAAFASRAIEAGHLVRAANDARRPANRTPRSKGRCVRPCGCASAAWRGWRRSTSIWSLNANRSIRPSESHSSDLGFSVEIVGLVAQMEAGVGRQAAAASPRSLRATAGHYRALRRPGSHDHVVRVKDRRDAVGDRLPVAVDQRHIDRESRRRGAASSAARRRRRADRRFPAAPASRWHRCAMALRACSAPDGAMSRPAIRSEVS